MLGTKLLGKTIPERITYADWFWQLAALAEARGYTLFFLGAQPGVAQKAADRLRTAHLACRLSACVTVTDSTPAARRTKLCWLPSTRLRLTC
ncbi:MAG: WecB/TagA/CpsF family glycosyltransferase [Candidatus Promineofilum sp.]|nr:WecB/TagA/CpsF family glycosyltransferase [Promineifilum sp.]